MIYFAQKSYFCLNSTMFRWNFIIKIMVHTIRIKFKFHYVQMKLVIENIENLPKGKSLNSTMFRWNNHKKNRYEELKEICLNSTMFRWNFLNCFVFFSNSSCLNSTMFRWNIRNDLKFTIVLREFKFHYVQMKPPLLTFQTSFNKA